MWLSAVEDRIPVLNYAVGLCLRFEPINQEVTLLAGHAQCVLPVAGFNMASDVCQQDDSASRLRQKEFMVSIWRCISVRYRYLQ